MAGSKHSKKRVRVVKLGRFLYFLLVVVLIGAMTYGLKYLWDACAHYQANSAHTVLDKAVADLTAQTGLDVSYSPVPTVDANGDSVYILKDGKTPIGKATLGIKERGILNLALYELKKTEGTRTFELCAPEGVRVSVDGTPVEPVQTMDYFGTDYLKNFGDDRKPPVFYRYEVGGLYTEDQIEISCETNRLTESRQLKGKRFIEKRFDDATAAEISERARYISQLYSNYISLDTKWANLKSNIMADSGLLYTIPSLEVKWYNKHTSWDIENVKASEPLCLSDNYALVYISYDYIIYRGTARSDIPTELALYLHKDSDSVWRLAELNTNLYYNFEMK